MSLASLDLACPKCGSHAVVYSCNPTCCFNHVCSQCYTTFEPVTRRIGEFAGVMDAVPPVSDPTAPTAACARCRETALFRIDGGDQDGRILCTSCRALLEIDLVEIAPG